MTKLTLIAAVAENDALGKNNALLWHLPDDFKRFKNLTSGHAIIMGRKTFESLPKPLPNRRHIIITRDKKYSVGFDAGTVVHSMKEAIDMVQSDPHSFVIGGGEIYKEALKYADSIELTRVHHSFVDADTFFPKIEKNTWKLVYEEYHPIDERHAYDFSYLTYSRK